MSLEPPPSITRDFAVAVFVVHDGRVLLRWHPRLERWLPPGGHIESNELPDDAAVREVLEETGVAIQLTGVPAIDIDAPDQPRQLCVPRGIQLADIGPDHQHIDLVYFATGEPADHIDGVVWFTPAQLRKLDLGAEVGAWCGVALRESEARTSHDLFPSPR